jgi:SAM-dependent methyltransferase
VERGLRMAALVERQTGALQGRWVLEIGIGGGGIGRAFARLGARVVAGEYSAATVRAVAVKQRGWQERVPLVRLDGVAVPFRDEMFDLVLLNGVLEYFGCRSGKESPREYQLKGLRSIHRTLVSGGWLYLAIENRFYPKYALSDPHTHQPFVSWLPRRAADWYSNAASGHAYRHWTYSLQRLKRLLAEAGFRRFRVFLPIPSYQFPILLHASDDLATIHAAWKHASQVEQTGPFAGFGELSWKGDLWVRLMGALRTPQLASAFVVLCGK